MPTTSSIRPSTAAGAELVRIAETHADAFAKTADQHDRNASIPTDNFVALKESGFTLASAPTEFGGLGVSSTVDLLAALNRIGRACPSTAIGITMHMVGYWAVCREAHEATQARHPAADKLRGMVQAAAETRFVTCGVSSEPGTNICAPLTRAVVDGDDVVINGMKIFSTMSPAADVIAVGVRLVTGEGDDQFAMASILRGTPGLSLDMDAWDALGMRASGSGNTVLEDCRLPLALVKSYGPWGQWSSAYATTVFVGAALLSGTFLGIAEAARDLAVESATSKRTGPAQSRSSLRAAVPPMLGEIDMRIAACRAILREACLEADEYLAGHSAFVTDEPPPAVIAELQKAKLFVTRTAIDVVNGAMTVVGGASYMNKHPISRLYRDVRAGQYMQPFSPIEGFEYLGKTAIGESALPAA